MSIGLPLFKKSFGPHLKKIQADLLDPSPGWVGFVRQVEEELPIKHRKILILCRLKRELKEKAGKKVLLNVALAQKAGMCPSSFSERWSELQLYTLLRAVQEGLIELRR